MQDRVEEVASQRRRRIALLACRCCAGGKRVRPAVVSVRSADAGRVEFHTDLAALPAVAVIPEFPQYVGNELRMRPVNAAARRLEGGV